MSSRLLVIPGSPSVAPKPRMPVLRLSENFFQRWFLILLPIVVMAAIGFLMTQRITPVYMASATVNAAPNPLILEAPIGVTQRGFGETVADATARVMNERLGTDRFALSVAERAGLAEAIENDLMSYDALRRSVSVFSVGASLVDVQAEWSDPETSLRIVDATIAAYLSVVQSTVTEDARAAVDFYEDQRSTAEERAVAAAADLEAFLPTVAVVPDGVDLPLADEIQVERMTERLLAEEDAVNAAEREIASARFSVVQAESDAGQSIQFVDPPTSTFEPASTLRDKAVIFVVFGFLGLLVALTILVLSTHLDRSVRSAGDIEAAGGGVTVAVVPVIKSLRPLKSRWRAPTGVGNAVVRVLDRVRRGEREGSNVAST